MSFPSYLLRGLGQALAIAAISGACATDRFSARAAEPRLRVGAATAELVADENMVIGGGIGPGKAVAVEGQLRAVAVVLELPGQAKVAIVACDVLMMNRDLLDPAAEEIEKTCGIPFANILINATHTHHAPTTCTVHGYTRDEVFCRRVQEAIVSAVKVANSRLEGSESEFLFHLGEEKRWGQNSRLKLADGTIYWVGPRDDAVGPSGPFDPQLPVLAFRGSDDKLRALLYNHSTHTIGTRTPGARSPSVYGLAAQELEATLGGVVCFLEGASGSTHNLDGKAADGIEIMKGAVVDSLAKAKPRQVDKLGAIKRPFRFNVRAFDEATEDVKVSSYCKKRMPAYADATIEVFRKQREVLAPDRGQERRTWVQAIRIGDVAIVGVPAEFFTTLGLQIKERSPFAHTIVAELANDWIGYLPDREAHELGGYQTWTGLHSYAAPGTGERVVDEAASILNELHAR
jgi:hypothetical protein